MCLLYLMYITLGGKVEMNINVEVHLMRRTDWKRPCCWERLKAGGEGDNRE